MAADPRYLRSVDGSHRNSPAQHWFEGTDNDGSIGIEFAVPSGALVARIFSSVAAYFGPVAEAALDISGAGFNAGYIAAGTWSPQMVVAGRAAISVKAATGNLAIVSVQWGGQES